MSRGLTRFVPFGVVSLLVLSMVAGAFAAPRSVAAASQSVNAWIEVGATSPAPGCSIGLSVEIRSAGNAVSSTEVSIALFAGETLISADRAVTDGNGVAHLGVETGDASGSGWLDINVAGAYLTGEFIQLGAGSSCSDGYEYITASGDVPVATVASDSSDPSEADGIFVGGVPFYTQQRNLSCEYASLYIATAAYGNGISEYAFDDVVGWSDNPHWGYRGDITGWWGNTTDYGVYAEALAGALPQFGFRGEVFYGGSDPSYLISRIDADIPVLVWLGLWGDQSVVLTSDDGTPYTVTAGMHVVVAYGYNDAGVFVSDPAIGGSRFYSWSDFIYMWSVLDGMSLAVYA